MFRISVELVPRQKETFIKDLKRVKENFPAVDTINIPDILRYEINSLEGCKLALPFFTHLIPHLRAIAVDKRKPLPFKDFLIGNGIKEVLVVRGEQKSSSYEKANVCSTLELIKKFKQEMPEIKVYAALDPYRTSFEEECEYVYQKIDMGVEGFFTQPFFDLNLVECYLKKLNSVKIFWGISPVVSLRSKHYWETKNNVKFPPDFELTLEGNKKFAASLIKLVKERENSHVYFMPIKMDVVEYLAGII